MRAFQVFGLEDDLDDDELRSAANEVYAALQEAGHDVDGVAPVLRHPEGGDRDDR